MFNKTSANLLIQLRYASLQVNYMTIPVYILGAASLVTQVYFSDKLRKRGLFIMCCCVPVAAGYLICVGTGKSPCWLRWHVRSCPWPLPHFDAGGHLDCYQSVARYKTRNWNASRLFDCKHLRSGVIATVPFSTRTSLCPRQCHLCWSNHCRPVPLWRMLVCCFGAEI